MKHKILILIIVFTSSIFLNNCGRKAEPIKPSEIVIKN